MLAAGALDVYVAIDAAPERLPYLAANSANRDADWLADRVVEAVLLESLIQWQRKSGLVRGCDFGQALGCFRTLAELMGCLWLVLLQGVACPEAADGTARCGSNHGLATAAEVVPASKSAINMLQAASGVTTAHLHAAMWEFSCGGGAVPARVAEELRTLPPRALSAMVRPCWPCTLLLLAAHHCCFRSELCSGTIQLFKATYNLRDSISASQQQQGSRVCNGLRRCTARRSASPTASSATWRPSPQRWARTPRYVNPLVYTVHCAAG